MKKILFLSLFLMVCTILSAQKRVKVACVGNSITYGYTLPNPATDSYPSQLQQLLGETYEVGNFGKSGATLLNKGHRPYMQQEEFKIFKEFIRICDENKLSWFICGGSFLGGCQT